MQVSTIEPFETVSLKKTDIYKFNSSTRQMDFFQTIEGTIQGTMTENVMAFNPTWSQNDKGVNNIQIGQIGQSQGSIRKLTFIDNCS